MLKKILLLSFLTGAVAFPALAEEEELQRELERINERYKSFFEHDQIKERINQEREAGIPEHEKARAAIEREREQARREHRRPPRPDDSHLEAEYMAELKRLERIKEAERQDYVRQQQALDRVRNGARKIPENREAGLED